ncbi:hypothetical protein VP1G_05559 [Cytospora mali]|uniref:Spore coat protein SP96 n=1 Tax=Cytospora mali TaxID=578113 RepID=A0A194V304_CYTMA|nr:hypothetical protein VP1G_05559 [Valsa mali var. pyri (nom. inval.)]
MYKPTALLAALLMGHTAAHMEMKSPPPLRSKYNPHTEPSKIDYSMTNPLQRDGSDFPCKGYHALLGTPAGRSTASLEAGARHSVTVVGGAVHGGGSCQISLSTDGARTFTVLKSIIGNCPASTADDIDFTVPADVPTGEAVLAWSWHNRIGNREMYMNCAAVKLTGGSGSGSGRKKNGLYAGGKHNGVAFSSLPRLFVANVGNGCSVAEGGDVVYPDPGVDVVEQSTNPLEPTGDCGLSSASAYVGSGRPEHSDEHSGHSGKSDHSGHAEHAEHAEHHGPDHPRQSSSPIRKPTTLTGVKVSPSSESRPGSSSGSHSGPVPGGRKNSGNSTPGTPCADEGAWDCFAGGDAYQRCASGQWSVVMPVAPGTVCVPGVGSTLDVRVARVF